MVNYLQSGATDLKTIEVEIALIFASDLESCKQPILIILVSQVMYFMLNTLIEGTAFFALVFNMQVCVTLLFLPPSLTLAPREHVASNRGFNSGENNSMTY